MKASPSALCLVLTMGLALHPVEAEQTARRTEAKATYATINNFAVPDLLNGDDGLPPHPAAPLKYGRPTLHVDMDGNGIEEHAATLSFFNGRYYLYGEKWGCGKLVFFSGKIPGAGPAKRYPEGDYGGKCGIATYSSTDLTNWRFETLYERKDIAGTPAKPQVHWSRGLKRYVMWFKAGGNFARTSALYYALSDNPAGPWEEPQVATGDHLAHDFDIAIGPDGTGYIVTDSFSGKFDPNSPGGSRPLWDVWVQRLNPDLTGTVDTPSSKVRLMEAVDFEAVGFFEHDGQWYITGGPTCGNCQVPIGYVRAPSPLGPWKNEQGDTGTLLRDGTVLSEDGCTGQNKGADMLPSTAGPVVLGAVWGYRTSPSNYAPNTSVAHGDNSQAISSTYWFPMQFDATGKIRPMTCPASVRVPLATKVRTSIPVPPPLQPDCRIRNDVAIEQRWKRLTTSNKGLRIPLFQRTDDMGPFNQNGPVMNAPLIAEILFADGSRSSQTIQPNDISWAPHGIDLAVSKPIRSLILKTTATNGCYGVLAAPQPGAAGYMLVQRGKDRAVPGVQLYAKTNATPIVTE